MIARGAPLIERDGALRVFEACREEAKRGEGRIVFVAGEAGIGKTALLRGCAAVYAAERCWWGACDALKTPHPLAPLHDIARAHDVRFAAALRAGTDRTGLFENVLRELGEARDPTLVVVEDAHWADEATLDLLKFLGRRIDRVRAVLAVSYRDDEVRADHPLRRVIGELPREAMRRIGLSRLSRQGVEALARRALQSPAGLYEATRGNPLFVTEVLRQSGGGMPHSISDLVLGRYARLSRAARAVVDCAAIAPRGIERRVLDAVVPAGVEALDECLNSGLLEGDASKLHFRHDLARTVVETSLTAAAARELHGRVLRALIGAGERHVSAARLAHHAAHAGDEGAIARYAPEAARQAARRGAHREAAAHYRTVLAGAQDHAASERIAWLEEYARECQFTAQLEEAIAARAAAIVLHRNAGDPRAEARNSSELALAYVRALRFEEADAASLAAAGLLAPLDPCIEHAIVARVHAHLRMLAGDLSEAIAWGTKAIGLAECFGNTEVLAGALGTLGAALLFVDYASGRDRLQRAYELAAASGNDFMAALIVNNLGSGSAEVFRLREAREHLREAIAFAARRDIDSARAYATAWLATCEMYLGRYDEAASLAREVIEGPDRTISRVTALVALAHVHLRRGDPGASELLDEARALVGERATLPRIGPVRTACAESALANGALDAALREARAVVALAARPEHAWFAGEACYLLARAGAPETHSVPCAEPYRLQIEGRFREAADLWASLECPYERARALADGDAAAQLEALDLFDRLGAAPAAARVRRKLREAAVRVPRGARAATRANPRELTERELEVVALLCRGLRNAEIAERLHRSVRTIDHHLAAAFSKLDVSTRSEAVAAAIRLGIAANIGNGESLI